MSTEPLTADEARCPNCGSIDVWQVVTESDAGTKTGLPCCDSCGWRAKERCDCCESRIAELEREREGIEKAFREAGYVGEDLVAGVQNLRALFDSARAAPPPQGASLCDGEAKLIYEHGQPYGIRDRGGYLFFFRKVSKYTDQEERYRQELDEMARLAEFLLAALRPAPAPAEKARCKDGGTCGLGGFCDDCPEIAATKEALRVDRTHEECNDCVLQDYEPPRCNGHAAGPVHCMVFHPKPTLETGARRDE